MSVFILTIAAFFLGAGNKSLWADADVCGDFSITGLETCDDGNAFDGEGCNADCSGVEPGWFCDTYDFGILFSICYSICGDGIQVGFEGCDDGNFTNGDGCDDATGVCAPTGCGNFVYTPETGEICDDGNTFDGDGCAADCSATEPGWECDNSFGYTFCNTVCGDHIFAGAEQCEDGNGINGDGCDDDVSAESPGNCTFTSCGNLVQTEGEDCDDGKQCSDGTPCPDDSWCFGIGDELCKTREADFVTDFCDSNCTAVVCGNGIADHIENPDVTYIEDCDDGNRVNGDGCDNNCTPSACGNGILTGDEKCDDGNTVSDDGCSGDCKLECGDGAKGANEECDDGNLISGDGCSGVCTLEVPLGVCGNGVLESGEECDDGNTDGGDGCEADCTDQSFESANPVLSFGALIAGDEVVVNSPDPRQGSSGLTLKSAVFPDDCSCSWAITPPGLGAFVNTNRCQNQLTLNTEGKGAVSVATDCGTAGSRTFFQNIVVQPAPPPASGGCSLIRSL